jgi:hypothetical protein
VNALSVNALSLNALRCRLLGVLADGDAGHGLAPPSAGMLRLTGVSQQALL